MNIEEFLDLEKDLRLCEDCLSFGVRYRNCIKDSKWFDSMEEIGFLVKDRFLPIVDMIELSKTFSKEKRVFALEAVFCGLSEIVENQL